MKERKKERDRERKEDRERPMESMRGASFQNWKITESSFYFEYFCIE